MRAGFASVHADEDVRCAMTAIEIPGESASGGVKSGVVQRRRAREAANPVGSKKLLGHVKKPVSPECGTGPVGPTSVWMASAKLNTRKTVTLRSAPAHAGCLTGNNGKTDQPNLRICCFETAAYDVLNGFREFPTGGPRSRSCPRRKPP